MEWKTITYELLYPLDEKRLGEGAEPVSELTFQEPDGETLERIDEVGMQEGGRTTVAQANALISILSGVDVGVVRKMHRKDIEEAGKIVGPLLGEGTEEPASEETT